nr:fimbria/pilus outer membrane usher protein [uncultured Enterobacter sp.]
MASAVSVATTPLKANEEYTFDDSLLRGNNLNIKSLSRFNTANNVEPGDYQVDVYINARLVDRMDIKFDDHNQKSEGCLTKKQLLRIGVRPAVLSKLTDQSQCVFITDYLPGSRSDFDFGHLRLDLSVPQNLVVTLPRGYVDPANLDEGESIGFVNYNANQYHVQTSAGTGNMRIDSSYVGLSGGINAGMWRFRQQGSWRHDDYGSKWERDRTYVQRALPFIRSDMTLGETFTPGQLFSSLGFRGVSLSSDDRMLPDSMRGYAPTIRGIAKTNARVTVYQKGRTIYESTVPPGSFEISDLSATKYGGDLTVVIKEADGSESTFDVPYASVPESLRPGISHYNASVGRVRDVGGKDVFGELTYQRGLSNSVTGNSGLRIANGYTAATMGGVLTNFIGAFGLDLTYSHAHYADAGDQAGWMARAAFSRTFQPTGTTLGIAGYRYSTKGYRELSDVFAVRNSGSHWQSPSYLQRSRYEISLNQSLKNYGSVFLSGSSQDYRDGRSRDTQLQFGYSTMFGNVSLGLSVSRQRTTRYQQTPQSSWDSEDPNAWTPNAGTSQTEKETLTQLTVSFPLGSSPNSPYVSSSASHSHEGGNQYQTSLSGTAGDNHDFSYSADVSRQEIGDETTIGGSMQQRFAYTQLGLSGSKGRDYLQGSATAHGSVAVHSGGVTFGPYLSDTFGLIEAKGAEGARIMDGQAATIDRFGYALVPTLMPYRYNTVSLDPEGISPNAELQDGSRRVAPSAGAAVKIKFRTLMGYPVLLQTTLPNGQIIPMGADVYDKGKLVGMMGQAGQAYLRASGLTGKLLIKWDDDQQCSLNYNLGTPEKDQSLIKTTGVCLAD